MSEVGQVGKLTTFESSGFQPDLPAVGGTVWAASAGQAVVDDEDMAKLRLTVPPNAVARGIALQMAELLPILKQSPKHGGVAKLPGGLRRTPLDHLSQAA